MGMSGPEEVLVRRSQKGESEAFEELVRRYERRVYNLAYRMTGHHEDAADVAQEAFLRVYRSLSRFRGESSFSTWLYRIVTNVCLDELRRRRAPRVVSLDEPLPAGDELRQQVMDPAAGPEETVEREELQRAVQAAIDSLGPDHRLVLILRELQGFSYEEIAAVTGCSLGTVKSRLNRARQALKQVFTGRELSAAHSVYAGERREQG